MEGLKADEEATILDGPTVDMWRTIPQELRENDKRIPVVDVYSKFLTITLPTAAGLGLLMIICLLLFSPYGKICKWFYPSSKQAYAQRK